MKSPLFFKVFATYTIVMILSVSVVTILVGVEVKKSTTARIAEELSAYAEIIDLSGKKEIEEKIGRLAAVSNSRVTLIDPNGEVVADSEGAVSGMESHLNRPEIQEAQAKGKGSATRYSRTLAVDMLYVALPIKEGSQISGYVRLARPLYDVKHSAENIYRSIFTAIIIVVPLSLVIAVLFSYRLTAPIRAMEQFTEKLRRGDIQGTIKVKTTGELQQLADNINYLVAELEDKIRTAVRDVTRIKQLEKMRADFVANVTHEIKTPLTSILGFVETLRDGAIAEKETAEKFLDIIERHARRLNRLVEDLLTISDIELGETKFAFESVALGEIAESVLPIVQVKAKEKNIAIVKELPESLPDVRADRDRLIQVLLNVLDNAVKFTPSPGTVHLSAASKDGFVVVRIEDTGIGIPREEIPRLGERFYRTDKTRSRELGGTGLGLSIVKHIMMAHGGRMEIESQLGRGTVVSLYFPVSG